jgi:hypothetical protein
MKNLEGSGPHTSIYVDYWIRVLVNNQTLKNFYSSKSPDKANIEAGKYLKTLIQSDSCGKLPLN